MEQRKGSQVDLGPWLSKFILPSQAGVITVTHDMAGDWLDYRIPPITSHQRKRSAAKVARYTAQINIGQWDHPVPPGIMADTDGWIFNGQHSLQALRDSVRDELEMWVFPNQPAELFDKVDVLYGRQARQLYAGPHATAVTSAVRYLGPEKGRYITAMSPADQLAEVAKWPELVTHATAVHTIATKTKIPAAGHLAVMAQAERTEHRDLIAAWLDGLQHGTGLTAGDPRLHLRERYMASTGRQRSPELSYNTIAKAWNHFVLGKRMQVLSWRTDEGMLSVLGSGADLQSGVDLKG